MSDFVIGILGVIAGALATGWVTGTLRWLDRRLSGLVAARVLNSALFAASIRLGAMVKNEYPGHPAEDWVGMMINPWNEHRDNLARVVRDPEKFSVVAHAFSLIPTTIAMRAALNESRGVPISQGAEITKALLGFKADIDEARPILRAASYSRPQRMKKAISARRAVIVKSLRRSPQLTTDVQSPAAIGKESV